MRENTPPPSPFFERDDMNDEHEIDDEGEDDELIYVGDGKYFTSDLKTKWKKNDTCKSILLTISFSL